MYLLEYKEHLRTLVREVSAHKQEPDWMLDFRCAALETFFEKKVPAWAADLSGLNLADITMYVKPIVTEKRSWDDVPEDIKQTFETLGIPQAERKFLAGVGAQFESEVIYKSLKSEWAGRVSFFVQWKMPLKIMLIWLKNIFLPSYLQATIYLLLLIQLFGRAVVLSTCRRV